MDEKEILSLPSTFSAIFMDGKYIKGTYSGDARDWGDTCQKDPSLTLRMTGGGAQDDRVALDGCKWKQIGMTG